MRLLFTSTSGFGSFYPAIALARAARDTGHEIAFATGPERRASVERQGMKFISVGRNAVETRALTIQRYPDLKLPPADLAMMKLARRALFGDVFVETMLPSLLEACRGWRPDVLVRAHLALAGWIAAEECGVPHVTIEEWASGIPGWDRENLSGTLNMWRERRGLPPDPGLSRLDHYLLLAPFPAPLRHPDSPLGPTARRIKPLLFSEPADGEMLPPWMEDLPDGPIVHASLGTVVQRPDTLKTIIEGLAGEPLVLVVACGPTQDPAVLEPLPTNTRVAQYLPHSLLLPRCRGIITHAGAGTLISAIDAGLPMVLVPLAGDQPWNAERTAAAGAGIVLDAATLTAGAVRSATRAILDDRSYADNVAVLRQDIDALPPHEVAVEWIAEIARTKAPLAASPPPTFSS